MSAPQLSDMQALQAAEAYKRLGAIGYTLIKGLGRAAFDHRVRAAIDRGFVSREERRKVPEDKPMPGEAQLRKMLAAMGRGAVSAAKPVAVPAASDASDTLKDQLRELRARVATAEKNSLDAEYVKRKIIGLRDAEASPPEWLLRLPPGGRRKAGQQVPTLLASDWHWGEVVDPRQVNGVNEFNLTIAQRRARALIERTVMLLKQHMVDTNYPGIIFALGGDMLSGDIHDELSQTNERPVMPALIDLMGVLIWCIRTLADHFGHVYVPCVAGNHGRNTKKPRAKQRAYTNFDWLLYQFLAKTFEGDRRVRFNIPDGTDAHWSVFGHRYCLTHGDQFRGGDGMIGALGPIARGDHKKRSRNGQIDLGFDTLLMGHWHQLIMLQRFIVNGSLKGYDEYADGNNFGFEVPQQALWITHADHGITFSMPVHLEEPRRQVDREWVKWAA